MNKLYIPNHYAQSIFTINYEALKQEKIKCLLFDVDNTIAGVEEEGPSKEVITFFKNLEQYPFQILLFSNATKKRLHPFKEVLNLDTSAFSCKPLKRKYKAVLKLYNLQKEEVAAIGDQLCTDIKGANKMGIKSILVNPLSKKESIITKINRIREKYIYKELEKRNILKRGVYYE